MSSDELLVAVVRSLWISEFTPCDELRLTLELLLPPRGAPSLLGVAEARRGASPLLAVCKAPRFDLVAATLEAFRHQVDTRADDMGERLRAALLAVTPLVCLDRGEALHVARAMARVYPGLLAEALESEP